MKNKDKNQEKLKEHIENETTVLKSFRVELFLSSNEKLSLPSCYLLSQS